MMKQPVSVLAIMMVARFDWIDDQRLRTDAESQEVRVSGPD
jgi:hypothetical protein